MRNCSSKSWDEIYLKEKWKKICEREHPDLKEISIFFKKEKVEKILDLGCGQGRNLIYLAKRKFKMYGVDFSREGLKILKERLKKEKLKAKLKNLNIFQKLPFKGNFFDAIIAIRVIHHGRLEEIKKLIKEIERILKRGGFFFGTVLGKERIKRERLKDLKFINKRTYLIFRGPEKGLYHFHFNKKILRDLLKNFKILKIWKDKENYLAFLAKKK